MRDSICFLRVSFVASLRSSAVARQAMHQQYFGPPGRAKTATKSSFVALVTGLKVSRVVGELLEAILGGPQGGKHLGGPRVLLKPHRAAEFGPVGPEEGVGP